MFKGAMYNLVQKYKVHAKVRLLVPWEIFLPISKFLRLAVFELEAIKVLTVRTDKRTDRRMQCLMHSLCTWFSAAGEGRGMERVNSDVRSTTALIAVCDWRFICCSTARLFNFINISISISSHSHHCMLATCRAGPGHPACRWLARARAHACSSFSRASRIVYFLLGHDIGP